MNKIRDGKAPIIIFVFLWLISVSIAYVYTHKAFTSDMLLAIFRISWQIFLAISVLSIAGGLGVKLLRNMGIEQTILYLAIGMGISSLVILIIGVFIGTFFLLFAIVFAFALLFLRQDVFRFWTIVFDEWKILAPAHWLITACAFLSASIVILNLFVAQAPPLAFDALVYHITLPMQYIQAGKIYYVSENMFWGMPQLAEMQYLSVLLLGGESAPAVLGWFLGVFTLLMLGQYLATRFNPQTGWFAIAALLSGFTISRLLGLAYIEWFLLFYALAWWIALENSWNQQEATKPLVIIGLISGFALSVKYTAGILLLLAIIVFLIQKNSWYLKIWKILSFCLVAVLISMPWWIKNFFWTGNPFYPLLLAAGDMDVIRLSAYNNIPSAITWVNAVTFPWYVVIWGSDGKVGPSASIGPILLAFAPLAFLGWAERNNEQRRVIHLATTTLLAGLLIWLVGSMQNGLLIQTRLFFTLLPLWGFLAGAGFYAVSQIKLSSVRFERIALAILLMFLNFNLLETFTDTLPKRAIETNLGFLSHDDYLANNLGGLYSVNQIIQALPANSRVVMLWETRSFYCIPRCDSDEIIDRWYHEMRLYDSAQAILDNWIAQGYTHMLIWESGYEFVFNFDNEKFNQNDWRQLEELRNLLGQGQKIENYTLYPLH